LLHSTALTSAFPDGSPTITATSELTERTSEAARFTLGGRVRAVWSAREILGNLVRKELKVKYTASALGAVWSLLNPVVYLAVFSFVVVVLRTDIPDFPVFLLSGLLAWNLFSTAASQGARAVIDNASLVKKVAFPREILPLSSLGVALVDFVLQSAVLLLFVVVSGHGLRLSFLWLYPLAVAALVVFTAAVTFWVSALNVRYRDVQHLVGIALVVWFWLTPIVYPPALVQSTLSDVAVAGVPLFDVYLANPMAAIVSGFHRAIYGDVTVGGAAVLPATSIAWAGLVTAAALAGSTLLLLLSWRTFHRLAGDFAEEL
jgi:ABC-2 type transport system permease protein